MVTMVAQFPYQQDTFTKKNNKLKFAKIKCIMYSIRIIIEMKTNVKIITNGCNEHMPSKHKR